jgi:hypothetical protein
VKILALRSRVNRASTTPYTIVPPPPAIAGAAGSGAVVAYAVVVFHQLPVMPAEVAQ